MGEELTHFKLLAPLIAFIILSKLKLIFWIMPHRLSV